MTRLLHALVATAFLIGGSAIHAADSPLGSPAAQVGVFSNDYAAQVKSALPRIDASALGSQISAVAAAAAQEKPLAITNLATLERFFDLPPALKATPGQIVDAGSVSYLFDAAASRIYLTYRHEGLQPVPRAQFAQQLPAIRSGHQALLQKLGVTAKQTFFVDFRETLTQSNPSPKLANASATVIESIGATTAVLRSIQGMMVDSSRIVVSSADAERLELFDVKWPRVVLSDRVARLGVVAPTDRADEIIRRITASAGGRLVNVRMAVVLRPATENQRLVYVPSLRVGVTPKSIPQPGGFRTDAGEVFYMDLVKDAIVGPVEPKPDGAESVPPPRG